MVAAILAFTLLLACTPAKLLDFAIPKWSADPNVRIEDAYKWLYQATRGGEHSVPDRETAAKWLESEWSNLAPAGKSENLWETLCPNGEIGRLNLRAARSRGASPDAVLDAFLASAAEYKAAGSEFAAAWNELGKRLKKHPKAQLNYTDWLRLDTEMKGKGYPAIHHSDTYNTAEHPAYRVITKREMLKLRIK